MNLIEWIKVIISKNTANIRFIIRTTRYSFSFAPTYMSFVIFNAFAQSGLMVYLLYLQAYLLNGMIGSDASYDVYRGIALFGLIFGVMRFLNMMNDVVLAVTVDWVLQKFRLVLLNKTNSIHGLDFFESDKSQNDIHLVRDQINSVSGFIQNLSWFIRALFTVIGLIPVIVYFDFWFSVVFLSILIASAVQFQNNIRQAFRLDSIYSQERRHSINLMQLPFNHNKEFKLFPLKDSLIQQITRNFNGFFYPMQKVRFKLGLKSFFMTCLLTILLCLMLMSLYNQYQAGTVKVGDVSRLFFAVLQIIPNAEMMVAQYGYLLGRQDFFNALNQLLTTPESVYSKPTTAHQPTDSNTHIAIQNLIFTYPNSQRPTLKNINLTLKRGEKVALVGENGCGKSTLIKLLCGFYEMDSGHIVINGKPIQEYNIEQLRQTIATVFQDFGIYPLTVKENIAFDSEIHPSTLHELLDKVKLKDKIMSLPQQENTLLNRAFGGEELSGGQKQKIAIARALFKQADILLLDEPTSALDPLAEKEIFDLFKELSTNNTTLFVTHRLMSIQMADRIVVMDKGEVVDFGTHAELMQRCELYRTMFESQSKAFLAMEAAN